MKKISILIMACLLGFAGLKAQDTMSVYRMGSVIYQNAIENINSMSLHDNANNFYINTSTGSPITIPVAGIDSIIFGETQAEALQMVYVTYNGETASVETYPEISSENFQVSITGADVSIVTNLGQADIVYSLAGQSDNGSFLLESDKAFKLSLAGLTLNSNTTAPIKLSKNKTTTVEILYGTTNTLTDNVAGNGKAVFSTKGATTFVGGGSLVINANKKNGISSDNGVTIESGTIHIEHNQPASKGIKCDKDITINGGNINILSSGTITFDTIASGYDPSYCTAIASDQVVTINGGEININIPVANEGGRGIKSEGNMFINGGLITIESNSNGSVYFDTLGVKDSYTSSCIKTDANLTILGGTLNLSATGSAGKCINVDSVLTVGELNADNELINISATTTGDQFLVSGSSSGGWGGPGQNSGDYANPKAIKAGQNIYINSGHIVASTQHEGGEGLESKDTLFIRGGIIEAVTYDDALNAAHHINISGGKVYAKATHNDAIDANGSLSISGGLIVAEGATAPETSFDCDNNTFAITGGTLIGLGGNTSSATSSACTQKVILYSNAPNNTAIKLESSTIEDVLTFQIPNYSTNAYSAKGPGGQGGQGGGPGGPGGSGQIVLFISTPDIQQGSYTLTTGGTIAGGEEFHGHFTNATYTGGTSRTINVSSSVSTTIQ